MKTIVAIISLSLCITVCAQESISLESQADALIQAYDNNDYEAFAKAFPSSYTNFGFTVQQRCRIVKVRRVRAGNEKKSLRCRRLH